MQVWNPHVEGVSRDLFTQVGHMRLALELLKTAVEALIKDPELKKRETRLEFDWLRGRVPEPFVSVSDAFASLSMSGWEQRFADLVESDPAAMLERLRGLKTIIDQMGGVVHDSIEAARRGEGEDDPDVMRGYAEAARPC